MAKRKIETGVLIGLIAIVINLVTVSVYIFQTQIMQNQQHIAAWPYLEWRSIYNSDDGHYLRIKNNGIGPALIKETTIEFDGTEYRNFDSLFSELIGTTQFPHLTSEIDNRVLPAGEQIIAYRINDLKFSEMIFYRLSQGDFKYEICFESVYKDKWISRGLEVIEGECR